MERDLAAALARIDLFAWLDDETRSKLGACLTRVRIERGETLFREGELGTALYLIESGEVRVLNRQATHEICRLGPGQHVGEMSVIDPAPRSATVVARRDTTLWKLAAADFESFAAAHSRLLEGIAISLARRLRETTAAAPHRRSEPVTLIVDTRVAAQANHNFLDQLVNALEVTTKQRVIVAALGDSSAASLEGCAQQTLSLSEPDEIASRVDCLLADYAHVLLVLQRLPSEDGLLRAAIGRADLVLILLAADPASLAAARQIRDRIARLPVPDSPAVEFAFDRRAETCRAPFGPIDELATGLPVHTVARTPGYSDTGPPDFGGLGRLARRIARRRVGLAMGGGGARALAHIGVLAVFERTGIPVDVLAGTSAGAIVAGLSARDWSAAQIADFLLSRWNRRGVVDWGIIPWVSLLRGRKLDRLGRDAGAGLTLQELTRPFVPVATDLVTGEEVRLRRGDGWTAVRASLTVPGVFPPVRLDDRYLVDGGAINNLPAAAAREAGADIVIGINVTPPLDRTFLRTATDQKGGHLFKRLRNWRNSGLPLFRIIYRTISIQGQALQARQGMPDLTLTPDVSAYDLFEFADLNPIIERGRLEAQGRVEELRRVALGRQ
jgi:NTE family protein